MWEFSPTSLREQEFYLLIWGPLMVPLIGMTKDASVHHTRTRARSLTFRIYSRLITCDL